MSIGRKIVFVVALIVFVGALGAIIIHYVEGAREKGALQELTTHLNEEEGIQTDKGYVIGKYASLYKRNHDIIGWVEVKDTQINYPVMQTQDDAEFYLRKNFDKEYAVSGVPFMDAASDIFKPTSNWFIYGHHMKNGTMFHDLLNYEQKDFYEQHKTFRFDTIYKETGQAEYEVVAAFRSQIYPDDEDVFKYYAYAGMSTKEEFNKYVEGIKGLSMYDTGITPKYGDQLVTLSTCSYHISGKNGRFAVVGRRIDK